MPLADKIFYVVSGLFLVVFGTGLWMVFIEHEVLSGSILSIIGVIGVASSLIEPKVVTHGGAPSARYVAVVLIAAFVAAFLSVYDIVDRHTSTPPVISQTLTSWGRDRAGCVGQVQGSALGRWRGDYDVYLACGVVDPTVDKFNESNISISQPFKIESTPISIAVPYSPDMRNQMQQGMPPLWFEIVLLPKHVNVGDVRKLSDIKSLGGITIGPQGVEEP